MEPVRRDVAEHGAPATTVLLVEDHPGDARLIREALKEASGPPFTLEWVERVGLAIERLATGGVDVVLLDLSLPDGQGIEVFQRLRAAAPEVPVVVLSGLNDDRTAIRAVNEGAQDYLVKGASTELLTRAIRYAIERHRLMLDRERERTALLKLIVEQAGIGILFADQTSVLRLVNPEAERQLGVIGQDVPATQWVETFGLFTLDGHQMSLEETPLHRALQGESLQESLFLTRRPDGSFRTLSGTASPLRHPDGKLVGAVLMTRDETERVRSEEQRRRIALYLAEANKKLAREMASKVAVLEQLRHADRLTTVGKLASGIAHELGTPLNVVLGRAKMIASGEVEGEDAKASAATIASQTERMAQIIRQLMDFARRRGPNKANGDLRKICKQTLSLLKPMAEKRRVKLELTGADAPLLLMLDAGQLQQVLTNLCVNAVQAMDAPGRVRVEISVEQVRPPPTTRPTPVRRGSGSASRFRTRAAASPPKTCRTSSSRSSRRKRSAKGRGLG